MAVALIADDSPRMRLLLSMVFTGAGHTVVEAADGTRALELLREHHPDIAVLDVDMPGIDGLELCRLVRVDPSLRTMRLIVISGNASADDAHQAGADCFLAKPFRPSMLLTTIAGLLPASLQAP